jgi:hypothetical protein
MPARTHGSESLASDLEALQDLPHAELKRRWNELYEMPCPPHMNRMFLIRAVAYRIQEQAIGGLDRATRRRLDRAAKDLSAGRPLAQPRPAIKPGTRLLREWQGRVHEVLIVEGGVEYRGQVWPSLSAVAREITGTRWSGPRFFGLKEAAQNGRD